jgi:hypothetical protein
MPVPLRKAGNFGDFSEKIAGSEIDLENSARIDHYFGRINNCTPARHGAERHG